jgi:putative hemolysin
METSHLAFDVIFITALILCNGALSMSEMSLVSARRVRLQSEAARGNKGAAAALRLIGSPSGYLAAVQVGITAVGVLAGAFGGANIAASLAKVIQELPLVSQYAEALALGCVVAVITILSIVFGELIPKRLAMGHPETLSIVLARPVELLSFIARPLVRLLTGVTDSCLAFMAIKKDDSPTVTDDELRSLVEEGTRTGVFEKEEETIIKRTLRLGDRTVEEVMTRRGDVVLINVEKPLSAVLDTFRSSRHSFFPVYQGQPDQIIGVLSAKDLLAECIQSDIQSIRQLVKEPLFVSETLGALQVLETFKTSGKHFAVVYDEHGGMTGVLSVIDVLEAIVGGLPETDDTSDLPVVVREDGSLLIDGSLPLDDFTEAIGITNGAAGFPEGIKTLGGFIMDELGHIPRVGDHFLWMEWRFEVMDMDGRRVDKVLVMNSKALDTVPASTELS